MTDKEDANKRRDIRAGKLKYDDSEVRKTLKRIRKKRVFRVEERCTESNEEGNFMHRYIVNHYKNWQKWPSHITLEACIFSFIKNGGSSWHKMMKGKFEYRIVNKKTKEVMMTDKELQKLIKE